MSDTARMTAAPTVLNIGGTDYFPKPLTYKEIGILENAAVEHYLGRVKTIADKVGGDMAARLLKQAEQAALALSSVVRPKYVECAQDDAGAMPRKRKQGEEEIIFYVRLDTEAPETIAYTAYARFLGSPEGSTMFVWLMLRGGHPELTLSGVAKLIQDDMTKNHVIARLNALNASGGDPVEGEGSGPKKP